MRPHTWLFALCAAHTTAAAAALPNLPLSEEQLLQQLVHSPSILPINSRRVLAERISQHENAKITSRSPQSSTLIALLGGIASGIQNIGSLSQPDSRVADVSIESSTKWPGALRKKIRYGPYRIPPVSEKNLESRLLNQSGLTNTISIGAKKPCNSECTILRLTPGLEDEFGKPLDDTAWLHHAVLVNIGNNLRDPTCGGIMEHVFESGNERVDVEFALTNSTVKSGYKLKPDHIFMMNTELMNMQDKEKWAWLTLSFDYFDGPQPTFKDGRLVWVSIGPNRCTDEFDPSPWGPTNLTRSQQPLREVFSEYSVPWIAPKDGVLIGCNGHMHDGGVSIDVYLNEKHICDSRARYSAGGHSMSGPMVTVPMKRQIKGASNLTNTQILHIDSQSGCWYPDPLKINKGDKLYIKSNYDFTKYAGMKNKNGDLDEVMGIMGSLVAFS